MEFNTFVHKKHWYNSFWADLAYVLLGALALMLIFGVQYATGEFGFSADLEKNIVESKDTVIVNFSQPVSKNAVEKNFEITPVAPVDLSWSDNFRKLEIKPQDSFSAGENYTLKISPQDVFSFSRLIGKNINPVVLSFRVASPPQVVSILPVSGESGVKIDSAIKISFDKSTFGYDVNFIIDPSSKFDLSYDSERKNFTLLPKGKFDYERDYSVSVRLAPSDENAEVGQMPEIFRANFKTEASPPPPETVEEVVLPEDKIAGIVADSQVATTEAAIAEGRYIDINLAKQQLSIFENGERLGTYLVSTGKRGMATPTGTFHVMAKRGRAWSKKYNLYMPYFMQFTGQGHGIHELPEWKNGYKEGANHLGTPVSHGCVRLGVGPAAKVYDFSEVGTPIVIHY
ncbi:MAG: L,D-transpeptidase family protein [Candidatus Moranbacteria bacterium]|nr:L,D-transpeptidase family protein [Candidatus Moranbacteria bacterium]